MLFSLVLFLLLFHQSQQKPVLDAKQHLHKYGFLNSTDPDAKTLEEAIKKFQQINGLGMTGTFNERTMNRMSAPRCGRPSNVPEFAKAARKWESSHITYKIVNWSEPFTKAQVRDTFEEAIMSWTDTVNLKITETDSNRGDILVHFTEQDGPHEVLGYAYYPEIGDIYFDADEDWTLDSSLISSKTYFGWVAAHELGHSLGLPHSETMKSIMFPYYSDEITSPTDIDIRSLASIYGKSAMNNSILCSGTSVDAILDTKDPMIIKEKQYWVLTNGKIQSGPLHLDLLFPRLPKNVDAAFMVGRTSYFLNDNIFYKFGHRSKRFGLKRISVGFDNIPSNISAAFYDPNGRAIYFFKGSKYYKLEVKKPIGKRVTINGRDAANDWGGIPKDVEAASLIGDSQVLFIKDGKCYVVGLDSRELLRTEDCAASFYGCQ